MEKQINEFMDKFENRCIKMKKVIVTGANGFVGSALVKELVKNDVEILAMDMPGCNGNLPVCDKVKFLPLALDNISSLKD